MNLRRRCEEIVRRIDGSDSLPIEKLCEKVGLHTGRPIVLEGIPFTGGSPSGVWISTGKIDYIFHDSRATPLHREHVVAHELGHILCDHRCGGELTELSALLMPNLSPEMVTRVLHRARYDVVEEQEAETIASLLMYRSRRCPSTASRGGGPVRDVIRRVERTLLRRRASS
ncbi:ImmA/IrrE family metallo-endopeptidase [Streptomyces kanasensis]|uniref:ImmA/IrrE family metallo-endopeptidase n=1 Tax=Streptomyces kanasensis TaxID=936756 RepID=UPI0036F8F98E